MSLMPRRLDLWTTPGRAGAAAARVLYKPRHRARIAARVVAPLLPTRTRPSRVSPPTSAIVEHVVGLTGVEATAAAALHIRGKNRWVYAFTSADDAGVIVKVGNADDEGLAREASTLAALGACPTTLRVPRLRWHGEHDGFFALVTDIVERSNGSEDAGIEDALAAACALATMNGDFVVHGDLAPWNMIPSATGLALVDWEKSRFEHDPLHDLSHYVVRTGALLHKWRPRAAVEHLVGSESVGARYLQEIGLDPASAAEHLLRYLGRPTWRSATNSHIRRYEIEMADVLGSNPT
jgi:hypothetical protein